MLTVSSMWTLVLLSPLKDMIRLVVLIPIRFSQSAMALFVGFEYKLAILYCKSVSLIVASKAADKNGLFGMD